MKTSVRLENDQKKNSFWEKKSIFKNWTIIHGNKSPCIIRTRDLQIDPSMTQHTYPEINEYYFFHGTDAQHVNAICSQGLDSRLAGSGRLGSGVYGAEEAVKSAGYARKSQFS